MTRYEYRDVRVRFGFLATFSKNAFHDKLMHVLQEQGNEGWELKGTLYELGWGILYELGWPVHLIFARPTAEDVLGEPRPRVDS